MIEEQGEGVERAKVARQRPPAPRVLLPPGSLVGEFRSVPVGVVDRGARQCLPLGRVGEGKGPGPAGIGRSESGRYVGIGTRQTEIGQGGPSLHPAPHRLGRFQRDGEKGGDGAAGVSGHLMGGQLVLKGLEGLHRSLSGSEEGGGYRDRQPEAVGL